MIVAIGGGSVMDAAKLCSVLKGASYTVKRSFEGSVFGKETGENRNVPTT